MKHHDSLEQANKKLALSLKQLAKWHLPATPLNYAVTYEYINGKNTELITAINIKLNADTELDNFFLEELYSEYILGQSKFREEIIEDMDDVLSTVQNSCLKSSISAQGLIDELDGDIQKIEQGDTEHIAKTVKQLKVASSKFKKQQQEFAEKLQESQQRTKSLRLELEDVRKEIYLDPITGLYNKKALSKHFDSWMQSDPQQKLAAIVVNVDHFNQFSTKFGSLIGDVILTKIATKISGYVDESGLPVRYGNDEFVIILPEVEGGVATEIAEKIRQGVEKLRFISSKTGVRLPQMTISLGVTEFIGNERLNSFINRTKLALRTAQQNGRNRVALA